MSAHVVLNGGGFLLKCFHFCTFISKARKSHGSTDCLFSMRDFSACLLLDYEFMRNAVTNATTCQIDRKQKREKTQEVANITKVLYANLIYLLTGKGGASLMGSLDS